MPTQREIEAVRELRLDQAEKRGIIKAACALQALGDGPTQAAWIDEARTIAAECRPAMGGPPVVVRVWANLDGKKGANPFGLTSSSAPFDGPQVTSEDELVLEVEFHDYRTVRPAPSNEPVLEAYVPGDWETRFITFVSTEVLERRLNDRRKAIEDEAKDTERALRLMRRWGA